MSTPGTGEVWSYPGEDDTAYRHGDDRPVYYLADNGTVAGVHYVTVINATGDPVEYEIPLEQAIASYRIDGFEGDES